MYVIDDHHWVEERLLPEPPEDTEDRRTFQAARDQPALFSSVCLSESLAAEYLTYRIGYKRLRTEYEADQRVWSVHREAYELKNELAQEQLEDLQPSWWEEYDAQITGLTGFVLGTVSAIAVTYAVKGVAR